MPAPKITRFSAFEFSEQEYSQAVVLNSMQKMHIQNEISKVAELILNLTVDHKDIEDFAVQHSYLKGQLDILTYLIQLSESAEVTIRDDAGIDIELASQHQPLRNLFTDGE